MKTPADWLAEQVTARPNDFAPDEMAAPLAWIASVQADARKDLVAALGEIAAMASELRDHTTGGSRTHQTLIQIEAHAIGAMAEAPPA